MGNKFTTIKERCLQIAKYKGISYEKFCDSIGMTYGNFKGMAKKTPINSNAIVNILSMYSDIDIYWLLLGDGEMVRQDTNELIDDPIVIYKSDPRDADLIAANKETIETQRKLISSLESRISELERSSRSKRSTPGLRSVPVVDSNYPNQSGGKPK